MNTITPRFKRPFLSLILLTYLLLTVGYGLINPLFEAPDEHWHYFTAQYIADTSQLPTVAAGDNYDKWLSQEAAQPPLYYLLGSLLIRPIDTSNAREQVWENPFAWAGNASLVSNYNRFIHTDAEAWPWRDYALAAHLLRLMSTLFGLGTLICVYANGRLLWPAHTHRALLATALVAFLPQFNFLHASTSNDSLVIFLASATLWQLVWLWQIGKKQLPAKQYRWRLLLLGSTIGLAALAKNAGILLLVYAAGFLLLLEIRDWKLETRTEPSRRIGDWRQNLQALITNLFLLLFPVLAIAGWLWWRNWTLYGDPTAASVFVRIAGGDRNYTLWQVFTESSGLWASLFGIFGWFNRRAPEWFYAIWDGMALLGIIGLLLGAWRLGIRDWRLRFTNHQSFGLAQYESLISNSLPLLLFGWILAVYAGLVSFMLQTEAAQGRLLFPAVVPLALGLAYGLTSWQEISLTRHLGQGLVLVAPLLALFASIYALFFVIRPAYAHPQLLTTLPEHIVPINQPVGEDLLLLGADVPQTAVSPNDLIPLTLYWQATAVPQSPPEFVLQLFGRDLTLIGSLHSYHGRGLYPATLWPLEKIVADQIVVRVEETAVSPTLARLLVGIDSEPQRQELSPVKIVPPAWPEPDNEALAKIGDGILLTDVTLSDTQVTAGDVLTVTTQWQVTAPINNHYTTLLHLAEAGQAPLAQGDRPPLNGDYPTSVWDEGEVINDQYQLTIPADIAAGRYPLWLGMYDSTTITRLPLSVADERQQHDLFLIGYVEVSN